MRRILAVFPLLFLASLAFGQDFGGPYYQFAVTGGSVAYAPFPGGAPGGGGGGGGSPESIFVSSFTVGSDTPLENDSPGPGLSWLNSDVGAKDFTIEADDDEVHGEQAVSSAFTLLSTAPAGNNWWVEVNGKTGTSNANNRFGSIVNASTAAAPTTRDLYFASIWGSGIWELDRQDDSSGVLLASGTIAGFNAATYYTLRLESNGNAKTVYIDGVAVSNGISDGTYGGGMPGIYIRSNVAGESRITWAQGQKNP